MTNSQKKLLYQAEQKLREAYGLLNVIASDTDYKEASLIARAIGTVGQTIDTIEEAKK